MSIFPLYQSMGSVSKVLGIDVYGNSKAAKRIRPIFLFIDRMHRKYVWGFKYRFVPKHQYHLVNTKLEPGYHDIDYIMLHANMALLLRYVDDEHGGIQNLRDRVDDLRSPEFLSEPMPVENVDWAEPDQIAVELYDWWTVERPANHDRYNEMMRDLYGGRKLEFTPIDKAGNEVPEDDAELFRLIPESLTNDKSPYTNQQLWDLEKKLDEDDTNNLIKLIKVRKCLWT